MAESALIDALAMSTLAANCDFKPCKFQRRAVGEEDVLIFVKYCGVCHSDLHTAAGHLNAVQPTVYPCVPGHEVAGVCVQVGAKVTKFQVGDRVGVGCMVDSCLTCQQCVQGEEQKCRKGFTGTYQGANTHGRADCCAPGGRTWGGYSSKMVVHERFVVSIPNTYPLEKAGPVMCAGITMYDPMKAYGMKDGSRIGIVGLGGLGKIGVQIARAMGCSVTAISRGEAKKQSALQSGAHAYIDSTSSEQIASHAGSLDLIINTISAQHDWAIYSPLLAANSKQVLIGLNASFMASMVAGPLGGGRFNVSHSMIGGIRNTQEVMDLCSKNDIYPEVKVVPVSELNNVYDLLDKDNREGLRYVLDIEGTLNDQSFYACKALPPSLSLDFPAPTLGKVFREIFKLIWHSLPSVFGWLRRCLRWSAVAK